MIQSRKGEYCYAVASTIEEARKLAEACFKYVTELGGVKFFRKRN